MKMLIICLLLIQILSYFSRGCVTFFLLVEGAGGPYPAGVGGGGRESHPPASAQGPRQRQVKKSTIYL
jgi:hypothetical protein